MSRTPYPLRPRVMTYINHIDHVGVTVADLEAATEFFVALGLEEQGRTFVEGEFIDALAPSGGI